MTEEGARPLPPRAASRRDPRRAARAVLAVIGLGAPVVVYLAFIHHYALNVVARDEWSDVSTVWLSRHGKMGLDQLWTPGSVDRLFFPRLVVTVRARLGRDHRVPDNPGDARRDQGDALVNRAPTTELSR